MGLDSERGVMMEHIESCAINDVVACTHNEGEHRWSGWPQAFCLDCHASDLYEVCIGDVCKCQCHREFWEGYERAMQKKGNRW